MMLLGVIIGLVLGAPLGLLLSRLAEANGEDTAASDVPAELALRRLRPTTPMVTADGQLGVLYGLGGTAGVYVALPVVSGQVDHDALHRHDSVVAPGSVRRRDPAGPQP